jgi:splicing factor 1
VGKGSAKEGSKGRAAKNVDEDEELHVHVQGDDEEKLALACKKIDEILRPLDDTLNEHKQKQLKQLALINGTLRENEYCPVCGEKGHQQFDCPYRAKAFKAAGVKCSICGDLSHPTRDCPMRREGPANESMIESEYDNFIAELNGGGNSSSKVKKESSDTAAVESLAESDHGSIGNSVPSGARVNKATGQTILAPIVDMLTKKPQTIYHVNTVLTGAAPPSILTSKSSSADLASMNSVSDVSSAPIASSASVSVSAPSNTSSWPASVNSVSSLPVTTIPPVAASTYGAYYPINAYSAYYGYDPATLLAMQQQPMATSGYPTPPPPPVAPPLPSTVYAPPPPPPILGYMPPPPPPPSTLK